MSSETKRKVIIDCDPGFDDSFALLLALSPLASQHIEVLGLTITHGNLGDLDMLGRNACYVQDIAGCKPVPVYLGGSAARFTSLHGESGAPHVHGSNGLGDIDVPAHASTRPVDRSELSAAEFIVRKAREFPGEVTVVALGPMTNLAVALKLEPELPELVQRVYVMGGAIGVPGNITPLGEANVVNDPEAAHMVFNAGWHVVLSPLNVTTRFLLGDEDLVKLRDMGGQGKFVYEVSRFYMSFFRQFFGRESMAVHDPTCVLSLLFPDVFTERRHMYVDVEKRGEFTRGVCVGDLRASKENADERRARDVEVLLDLDTEAALARIYECFASYSEGSG